jgi:hypothetical protein
MLPRGGEKKKLPDSRDQIGELHQKTSDTKMPQDLPLSMMSGKSCGRSPYR